ncbi:MAG: rod shape-determining protein MreD [Candidatus Omnitrophota bacterium]|nr:MAG: rod shape-determining protein MreD [Candidatus Omnitrophota bacterium]
MYRHRLAIYVTILLLFFAELILFDKLRIYGMKPEILLIVTIFFGFHFGIVRGMKIGAFCGILKDLFSITAFGVNIFLFLLIGFLSGYLKDKLFKENFVTQFLFSCFSVYIVWGIFSVGTGFFPAMKPAAIIASGTNLSPYAASIEAILYKGLYTGIFAPFLFLVLTRIFGPEHTA